MLGARRSSATGGGLVGLGLYQLWGIGGAGTRVTQEELVGLVQIHLLGVSGAGS